MEIPKWSATGKMIIRNYRPSDAAALERMATESGFPYEAPDSPLVERCMVVEMDGEVVGAIAAKRIIEAYLWKDSRLSPAATLSALRAMHEKMAPELRLLGYHELNTFLHPSICERFGRRLRKSFGWVNNWPSLAIKF